MTHKTKGIVLRTIKYGETSVVATILTEIFGVQTYLINGVRKIQKKDSKAIMLQPSAILDLEVYHNELKKLQRIKSCSWVKLYSHILSDVVKNSIATFMVELIYKTLKEPENNPELFYFCEDAFLCLDESEINVAANFPLYFSLQLPYFLGFKIESIKNNPISTQDIYLDLQEGYFTDHKPFHNNFIQGELALITAELLKVMHPTELNQIRLNKETRRLLLTAFQQYFGLHVQDFGQMKTLKIMQDVLGS
jgi:DNA repair protein RecO (recombination protein O)